MLCWYWLDRVAAPTNKVHCLRLTRWTGRQQNERRNHETLESVLFARDAPQTHIVVLARAHCSFSPVQQSCVVYSHDCGGMCVTVLICNVSFEGKRSTQSWQESVQLHANIISHDNPDHKCRANGPIGILYRLRAYWLSCASA